MNEEVGVCTVETEEKAFVQTRIQTRTAQTEWCCSTTCATTTAKYPRLFVCSALNQASF